jgi:hypothetical protein
MRFCVLLLIFPAVLSAQSKMAIRPSLITQCTTNKLSRARIAWSAASSSPVQVRVGSATGPSLTGPVAATGESETGDWITDGMMFVLIDSGGAELARVTAQVQCSNKPDPVTSALATSTYFPLQVGNVWVYRINSRVTTSSYLTRRVTRTEIIGGKLCFIVADGSVETPYRTDELGRVFQLDFRGNEFLWLDPTPTPDPAATLKVLYKGIPFRNALGAFQDSLQYQISGFLSENGTFVRGIGFISKSQNLNAGSSGGFSESLDLVWARIGPNLRFGTPAIGIELSVESLDLNVSGNGVTNCAVPCYFPACGIGPGADPPNTYKPCFQAGVRLHDPSPFESPRTVAIDLLDSTGAAVFHTTQQVTTGDEQEDGVIYQQVPLYTAPNAPVPPGTYQVTATVESSTARTTLRVR